MKFPVIGDIATVSVISLSVNETIMYALEMMLEHEHRNIIVIDGSNYRILNVMDIIKIKNENYNLQSKLSEFNLPLIKTIDRHKNVLEALEFINENIGYICVLNSDESLYGLVAHSDITANIDPDTLMDNYRLQDFFKLGRKVKRVSKDQKTSDVLNDMISGYFDNVIVIDNQKPIGILTTKDIMKMIKNKEDVNLNVSVYMSSPIESIHKSSSIKAAIKFIKSKQYQRVVVVDDDGFFIGVISQQELISLAYSKWAVLMKEYQAELTEINNMLENKNKKYEIMASTDALTGLYNRYKFTELYISSYKSMIQRANHMSLLMLDIDFFKKINDKYGHNIGDKVLIKIAHIILGTLRNIDIVCRWGGEELVILLPTVDLAQAIELAENIRENINKQEIDTVGQVSVSLGVSEVIEGDEMHSVIKRADDALYLAKKSGRNCVKSDLDI